MGNVEVAISGLVEDLNTRQRLSFSVLFLNFDTVF